MSDPVPITSSEAVVVLGIGPDGLFYPAPLGVAGSPPTPPAAPAVVPRSVHIASGSLPAAGAYTTQDFYAPSGGLPKYTAFWITYAWGAAGGQPKFKLEWSNGTEVGTELVVDEQLVAAIGGVTQASFIREVPGPIPTTSSAATYLFVAKNRIGATGVRLRAAELGVTATPGTCAIAITGGG